MLPINLYSASLLCSALSITTEALSVISTNQLSYQHPSFLKLHAQTSEKIQSSFTALHSTLGSSITPEHYDKEKKNSKSNNTNNDSKNDDDWTPTKGGFIPNFLRKRIRPKRNVHLVETLQEYKDVVVNEPDKIVVVRYFATWCKSCRASEPHFMKLVSKFSSDVKFVEVPLTKETAFMLGGLGVPTVPFAHIYHPEVGPVEAMKASKKYSSELQKKILSYVTGSCDLSSYVETGDAPNSSQTSNSGKFE